MSLGVAARIAILFGIAAALRLAFLLATPDRAAPFTPLFKGDAALWLAWAQSIQRGEPFALELGLPFRPPATAWLLAWLWDGTHEGLLRARVALALLGALIAPATYLAARRVGERLALAAGGIVAVAQPSIVLAVTPCAETPYALLALLAVALTARVATRPAPLAALAMGAVHGVASLFRAEHALFAVLLALLVVASRVRTKSRSCRVDLAAIAVGACVVLWPWQLHVHRTIDAFDARESPPCPSPAMRWDDAARARLAAVPGFARAATQRFVEATLAHRGVRAVDLAALDVVDEAFGSWPEPIGRSPFIALYGPLNFALANAPGSDGSFQRALLDAPPRLAGGASRYDPRWLAGLPRDGELSLEYPPHVELVNHGVRVGLASIVAAPGEAVTRTLEKLAIAWAGATPVLGASALPLGPGGLRRRVDLCVGEGSGATLVRLAWLALVIHGAWRLRRRVEAWPFAAWLVAGAATTVAFFGYARLGALALPALAVFAAAGCEGLPRRLVPRLGIALLACVFVADARRVIAPPRYVVDGAAIDAIEPGPPLTQRPVRVELR
ncbi:MAG: glycosyltransferase family 39 protein [Planctomycetes bacterium]|nr:glycosyltransferase family 39 protein [Planctomycetota bacterium]